MAQRRGDDGKENERRSNLSLKWGDKEINLQGYTVRLFVDIAAVALAAWGLAMLWDLKEEQRAVRNGIIAGNAQMAAAIRYLGCLVSLQPEDREKEFDRNNGLCSRMGRP
jgi:hypothetical protein